MLNFLNIKAHNFRSFGDLEYSLTDQGLVLIQGEVKNSSSFDSNGAGKSSLILPVVWALYGKLMNPKAPGKDEVVNSRADKDCMCSVTIQKDDSVFTVERYRKHSKQANKIRVLDANNKEITKSDTQAQIDKLVGMTFNLFSHCIYFGQGVSKRFTSCTDSERKAILEEILGIEDYRKASLIAVDLLKKSVSICNQLELDKVKLETQQQSKMKQLQDAKLLLLEFEANKEKKLKELSAKVIEYDEKLKVTLSLKSNEVMKLTDLQIKEQKAQAKLEEEQKDASSQPSKLQEKFLALMSEAKNLKYQVAQKSAESSKIRNSTQPDEELQAVLDKNQTLKLNATSDITKHTTQHTAFERELLKEKNKLKQILDKAEGLCSECGQPITEQCKSEYSKKVEGVITELDQSMSESKKLIATAKEQLLALGKQEDTARVDFKKRLLLKAKDIDKEEADLVKLVADKEKEAGEVVNEKQNLEKTIQDKLLPFKKAWELSKSDIETVKSTLSKLESDYASFSASNTALKGQISEVKESLAPVSQEMIQSELNSIENGLIEVCTKLSENKNEQEILEISKSILDRKGLPSMLMDDKVDFLTERANFYSEKLTDGEIEISFSTTKERKTTASVSDEINVITKRVGGGNNYVDISGGEGKRVDLCIAFALRDLAKSRAGTNIGFCIFDEAFEALDNTGCERVATLLKEESKDGSVLVITHQKSLVDFFDKTWNVVGGSNVNSCLSV